MKIKYMDGKSSPFYALGFVNRIDNAIDYLSGRAGIRVAKEDVERNIKSAYDNDDILYFEYDNSGAAVETTLFSEKVSAFAVNSGYCDDVGNQLYAQYSKNSKGWIGVFFATRDEILRNMNVYQIGSLSFKDYASANDFICTLHGSLLPGETWKYRDADDSAFRRKTEYQILESYLKTTLTVLVRDYDTPGSLNEKKIQFSRDSRYAIFNSGLLNKKAKPVFIVGEAKGFGGPGKELIMNPFILQSGRTELTNYGFTKDALSMDMASFFTSLSDIVYDATKPVDTDDTEKLEHCIEDGIARNRFPQKFKEMWDDGEEQDVVTAFIAAIKNAETIARRNYKYVVPQYRTASRQGSIQFLMPIYMLSNYAQSPDFALVLSTQKDAEGDIFYRPETVLELSWAYNNARAICKPDNTWLNPETIKEVASIEDDV